MSRRKSFDFKLRNARVALDRQMKQAVVREGKSAAKVMARHEARRLRAIRRIEREGKP
jgi:hypothetical protein